MAKPKRQYPKVLVRRDSCNQSSRNGCRPVLIVMHSTEGRNIKGKADLEGLGAWFDNPAAQCSSHAATDGDGHSARYVPDSRKAWHCAGWNSLSLGLEQVGQAAQSEWPDAQLRESGRWIAWWNKQHGIPISKGAVSGAVLIRPGVVRHSELGAYGGGHSDPGKGYDLHQCLEYARWYRKYI